MLPPKGHVPTAEEISILQRVDIHVAEERGVRVVGVPTGTEEYVVEPAAGAVTAGGADRLAR